MASKLSNSWIYAGLSTSFANITPDVASKTKITDTSCPNPDEPTCRVFQPQDSSGKELSLEDAQLTLGVDPQVLVFRYRDKIHAIDHGCPHRTYPLSRGSISDIEDFGVVLSAALTCPGHGWAFDLFTGEGDRGNYKLGLWEVEERDGNGEKGKEVWIRKKEKKRIG